MIWLSRFLFYFCLLLFAAASLGFALRFLAQQKSPVSLSLYQVLVPDRLLVNEDYAVFAYLKSSSELIVLSKLCRPINHCQTLAAKRISAGEAGWSQLALVKAAEPGEYHLKLFFQRPVASLGSSFAYFQKPLSVSSY